MYILLKMEQNTILQAVRIIKHTQTNISKKHTIRILDIT